MQPEHRVQTVHAEIVRMAVVAGTGAGVAEGIVAAADVVRAAEAEIAAHAVVAVEEIAATAKPVTGN